MKLDNTFNDEYEVSNTLINYARENPNINQLTLQDLQDICGKKYSKETLNAICLEIGSISRAIGNCFVEDKIMNERIDIEFKSSSYHGFVAVTNIIIQREYS